MKKRRIPLTVKAWLLLPLTLTLLLVGHVAGYDIWQVPMWQREQVWSDVDCDPKLTDRFFDSDEWLCRKDYGSEIPVNCRDGNPLLILKDPCDSWLSLFYPEMCFELKEWTCPDGCKQCATCEDGQPVTKYTARCYSTSFGVKHSIRRCEARSVHGQGVDLLIYEAMGAFSDFLRVTIRSGKFMSQYWNYDGALERTTTQQKLTLDKRVYQKGDVIKGRIDFECLSELEHEQAEKSDRHPRTIRVWGVFKTTVE